jgi:SAM-dependent methyltransferase
VSNFGNLYSEYYDLLYENKDYIAEVVYVDGIIKENHSACNTILDMGCGTGIHAELLCKKGYQVHGIDLSEDMLEIAKKRLENNQGELTFSQSNIIELNLNKKFDAVVSLFHVMCYQNSNEDLIQAFKVAKNHLNEGGLFIFDFWYGPAVLTDLPVTRVKKLENKSLKITRLVESKLHSQYNVVDVTYDMFIKNKITQENLEIKELHKIRYFFDTELEIICSNLGLKIEKKYKWLTNIEPDFNSWNAVWVIRK